MTTDRDSDQFRDQLGLYFLEALMSVVGENEILDAGRTNNAYAFFIFELATRGITGLMCFLPDEQYPELINTIRYAERFGLIYEKSTSPGKKRFNPWRAEDFQRIRERSDILTKREMDLASAAAKYAASKYWGLASFSDAVKETHQFS